MMYRNKRWQFWIAILCCFVFLAGLLPGPFTASLQAQTTPAASPKPAAAPTSATPANPFTAEAVPPEEEVEPSSIAAAEGSESLILTMKDLGDENGYKLKTVRTERRYDFTKPTGWKVMPTSHVKVVFQHSADLLPERSSLNIMVNNRILRTVPLSKSNVTPTTLLIPIPPGILKDRNTLHFQVDQHYTYQCEDPFSEELWTEVLKESNLRLDYVPQPVKPNLAQFPFPLFDPLGYGDTRIGFIAPSNQLSDDSLSALGVVVAGIAQQVGWHPMKPYLASSSALQSKENLVVIGTPAENPVIRQLGSSLDIQLSGDKFVDKKTRSPLPENDGVLQFIPNPYHPSKAILIVSGNSPAGVVAAGRLLMQNPPNRLLVGRSTVIEEQHVGPLHPYRAWDGFLQVSGATFAQLGLETLTARGVTSLPLYYMVKRMPDLFFPGQTKVKINTIYSYSSQLDPTQSKLEVLLNHKSIKSVALNDKAGKNLAELTLEIPSEEFNTFNELEYKFHLYPEKYDICNFVTDVHIWGTVHNSSKIEVPGEVKTALPDLGLINDAGFPFTGYQDLTQVGVVLPDQPQNIDLETMIQMLTRLGRESRSKAGINLMVVKANSPTLEALKKDHHLILIGDEKKNSLFAQIKSKIHLLLTGDKATLDGDNKALATIQHAPNQGIVEEMISPWNEKRVVLLAFGETDTAMKLIGKLFENDKWFGKIPPSVNLVVVNDDGPKGLVALRKGEARFFLPIEMGSEGQIPLWAWLIIGFFALMGLLSTLRFFFGR